MNAVLCLITVFIPVVYAGNVSRHRFDRQVALESLMAMEKPSSRQTSLDERTCADLCVQDGLCAAVTYHDGQCAMYRSTLTSSGTSFPGAKHFIKAGALPDPDPCPVSRGYTSVLSPRLCYKYISTFNNWTSQNDLCHSEGGRLVVLNSQEKQEFMASFQNQAEMFHSLWVGMQSSSSIDVFTWQDGSTYVWKWLPGEPDYVSYQRCGQLYHGEMSDAECDLHRQSVCEIPL
ncbi:C-type lectin lectoxin-Lio2-like [Haliotis rufescens]|uniref:C-type lectin lectoxin-Lio2-like n=1 Tax=Haliotis rufescens TaxID=6454 RepID=UPI00201EE8CF|nr:C-type lectin lectoxin-Lio2-like [Haliotis rufescens]